MSERELWCALDPDGNIVQAVPSKSPAEALLAASQANDTVRSVAELREADDLEAVCWRANDRQFGWSKNLASEIALLLGYRAVLAKVVRVEADDEG